MLESENISTRVILIEILINFMDKRIRDEIKNREKQNLSAMSSKCELNAEHKRSFKAKSCIIHRLLKPQLCSF